jgi:phosphoserine phosphatase RsbU/P
VPGVDDKLRDIHWINDAALSALDPQTLLDVLVARVRVVLQADTAAVLLLDQPSGELVAAAASGLEESQRGVRMPLGDGLAGQIAAHGGLVIINEADPADVVYPILLDKGIRSLMGTPLLVDRRAVGVLHVGTLTPRVFSSYDADLLQLAADRAALAVQGLTAQLSRATASALQHSLAPAALPSVSGLEAAARYLPGSGTVGGDWYDLFTLPSGEVCAVVGDVAGTGLEAAVIMGRLRSALRACALETADPAAVLDRLDRTMQHFEPDVMATVLCAMFSPSLDQVRISSAGHLPPVVARPGQPAAPADVTPDVLIGVAASQPRHVTTVSFPPGSVLCLYTDGLVECRGQSLDRGIARLSAALVPQDPEAACAAVMAAMADYSPHTDDEALLVLRRSPGPRHDSATPLSLVRDAAGARRPPLAARRRGVRLPRGRSAAAPVGTCARPARSARTGKSASRSFCTNAPDAALPASAWTRVCGIHLIARGHQVRAHRQAHPARAGEPDAQRPRSVLWHVGQEVTASIAFFSALGCAGDLGAFFLACSSLTPISWSCLRPRPARTFGNQSCSSSSM